MKRHATSLSFFALLALSAAAFADTTTVKSIERAKSLETVLSEISQSQGLPMGEVLELNKISDTELEQLGEVWMNEQFPDSREHKLADDMMGGQGSPDLAAAHRMLGYRALLYLQGSSSPPMMGPGMMEGSMMGQGRARPDSHVPRAIARGYPGYGMGLLWIVVFIILGVVIVATVLLSVGLFSRSSRRWHDHSHLDILKRRYAKGEISKKEFDEIKKDLS